MEAMSIVDLGRTAFRWDSSTRNKERKAFSFRASDSSPENKKGKKVSYGEMVDEIEVRTEDIEVMDDSAEPMSATRVFWLLAMMAIAALLQHATI